MTYPQQPPPYVPAPSGPPPKQRRARWPWVVAATAVLLIGFGSCGASTRTSSDTPPYYGPSGSTAVAKGGASVAKGAPAAPAAPAPAPSGPLTRFGDGTYEVGVDVAAGRYKTPGSGEPGIWGSCYWERSKNDSGSFDSIISNENLQGPGSVSLKPGEFFKTNGGCQWTKQQG